MEADPTAQTPITRREADEAYRRIRAYLVFSAAWFLAVVAVIAILGFSGWPIYAVFVGLVEGIGVPLFLRYYRRGLDERVRASEEALVWS